MKAKHDKPTPTGPLAREEVALAGAVARFRKLANLHDASPDVSIVGFAHTGGAALTGAEDVRDAAYALETAMKAAIGSGRGEAVDVRSDLLS